jgi:hypothetical protein
LDAHVRRRGVGYDKSPVRNFEALDPFFEVVLRGLRGLVDGEHYFETFAEDALFDVWHLLLVEDGAQRITLAFAADLESTPIKVNAACPGFTATDLNNFQGTFSNEDGPLPW